MGEIDDVAEVEDQRKTQRHQYVERANDESIGDVEQNDLGHPYPAVVMLGALCVHDGSTILHPVSATEPAASSPGTSVKAVKTSSGPDFGGCASPTKIFGISS